ncbi:FGGY-family carbohydrate kinase [Crocosphaera sp.]|uniref:rhamnulokinase n=1 Tax=Crocosphaera sp. TaxID=2729996 RepID=UPI002622FA98|nr:FGGY-family carbohydrate kinase [Crocosphaera sp.]MDJ0578648.1 FGGY-family carbohydrate kinase [Crocosphaera sp.]
MSKNSPTYLAFDLGWSSSRVILGWLSGENCDCIEIEELYRFDTPRTTEQGELYWNLETLWQKLNEGLSIALNSNPNVCSLSVDSWGFDYVPLNAQGNRLRNAYCYRSPRTENARDWVFDGINESSLYEATGIQFLEFNTLCQVMADQQQELDLPENRLMMADYFNYCFAQQTQDAAVSEVSLVSTSGLLDVHNLDAPSWSIGVMNQLGIPAQSWPQIVQSGTIIGSVNDHPSINVIASCSHDTACAVAAVPVAPNSPTWAYLSCGSWSLLGVERDAPITTEGARQANFTNEVGLDGTIRFLTNLTGLWVLQECQHQPEWEHLWVRGECDEFDYDTLLQEASNADNFDIAIDFNAPSFQNPDNMITAIRNYCHQEGLPVPESPGELARIIFYSLASSYQTALSLLEIIINEQIEILHIVGGGAQNYLLCQLVANVCQRQVVAGPTEATTLGNLLIQARTMGHLPTNVSIREVVINSTDLTIYYP